MWWDTVECEREQLELVGVQDLGSYLGSCRLESFQEYLCDGGS